MPRNRTKNQSIGTCLCPFRSCEIDAPLFRFRAATENEKMQRNAGKLYLVCPKHGRTSDQEYLLAEANITGVAEPQPEPEEKPELEPQPAPAPAPKKSDAWGFF